MNIDYYGLGFLATSGNEVVQLVTVIGIAVQGFSHMMGWHWMTDGSFWTRIARVVGWKLTYAVYAAREKWFDLRIAWIDWRLSLCDEETRKVELP